MSKIEYGQPFSIAENEKKSFPDFDLRFVRAQARSMGTFGNQERWRNEYHFVAEVPQEGRPKTVNVTWSWGFPGGIAPQMFAIARRKRFLIEGSANQSKQMWTVGVASDGPEYGEPVTFLPKRVLEFPDFDLELVKGTSKEIPYSSAEKQIYIAKTKASFEAANTPFTPLHEAEYLKNIVAYAKNEMEFRISHNGKSLSVTWASLQGVLEQSSSGGEFAIGGKEYKIVVSSISGGAASGEGSVFAAR